MKRIISLLICMCICIVFSPAGFAELEFDISVFENNLNYIVKFDDMNDTGEITPTEGGTFLGVFSDDEGLLVGTVDIKILEDIPPLVRLTLMYIGEDWSFTDNIIIKIGDIRYTFEVDRETDVEDGKIYEMFTLVLTDENLSLLENICTAESSEDVRIRLDGDRDVDGFLLFNTEVLMQLNEDYLASGALNNDFSIIYELYPCTVKDLSQPK